MPDIGLDQRFDVFLARLLVDELTAIGRLTAAYTEPQHVDAS
jgi:hypothetical protein